MFRNGSAPIPPLVDLSLCNDGERNHLPSYMLNRSMGPEPMSLLFNARPPCTLLCQKTAGSGAFCHSRCHES